MILLLLHDVGHLLQEYAILPLYLSVPFLYMSYYHHYSYLLASESSSLSLVCE
jgi:hypothetical protein